ncbi:hypothetical protein RQP46_011432 [Phenoliferia psychrophenolica]
MPDLNRNICKNCMAIETLKGGKELHPCSNCFEVRYRACQKVHWKQHKPLCQIDQAAKSDRDSRAMSYPHTMSQDQGLQDYHHAFVEEIIAVISAAHFPILHTPLRTPVLIALDFDSDMSQPRLRDQFRLRSAKVTTTDEYLSRRRCTGNCVHPISEGTHCPSFPLSSTEQMYGPTFDQYELEDARLRRNLSPTKLAELPHMYRFAYTAAGSNPFERKYMTFCLYTVQWPSASSSGLDVANTALDFFEPLRATLAGPSFDVNGSRFQSKLVYQYFKDLQWKARAVKAADATGMGELDAGLAYARHRAI